METCIFIMVYAMGITVTALTIKTQVESQNGFKKPPRRAVAFFIIFWPLYALLTVVDVFLTLITGRNVL